MDINVNESMFLKLLSAALFSDEKLLCDFNQSADWNVIYEESKNQAVTGLVFDAIKYLPESKRPSKELYEQWEEESIVSVMKNSLIMYAHKKLINIFDANGIKSCILKGASAAINYPKPDLRPMGDIDIFVSNNDFEKAQKLLVDNGYNKKDLHGPESHEIKFYGENVLVELHNNVGGIPDGEIGKKLYNRLQLLPETSYIANVGGIDFYKPDTLNNGVIFLLHIIHHLAAGIGIRQICDWAMYVNNELTDELWQGQLEPFLKENKLLYFTKVLTKTCCMYLGLPVGKALWSSEISEDISREFIEHILESGNFGGKLNSRAKSATLIIGGETEKDKKGKAMVRIFSNLQKSGYTAWPLARKYRFFRCFAWTYVPLRFIGRVFTGERSLKELVIILKSARERYPLIKKLKIFRD